MIKGIKMFTHTDLDGIGCGLVLNMMLGNELKTDISYVNYDEINEEIGKFIDNEEYKNFSKIFITDISVNEIIAEKINNINTKENEFVLLDHHETSKWLNKYDWCMVESVRTGETIEKISGTFLTSEYILLNNPEVNINDSIIGFIWAINSYDTWEWKNRDNNRYKSKELNDLFYILGRKRFIEYIYQKHIVGKRIMGVIDDFSLLLYLEEEKKDRYISTKNKNIIHRNIYLDDYTYKFGVVFAEQFISELGNKLNELNPEYDFIMIINDGKVSLRTIHDNIKVDKIAEAFGGGGHCKASGFEYTDKTKNKLILDILSKEEVE